jgi:hypothetical protein
LRHQLKDGFPAPTFYSGGKRFWLLSDIEAWVEAQPREAPKWLAVAGQKGEAAARPVRAAKTAKGPPG